MVLNKCRWRRWTITPGFTRMYCFLRRTESSENECESCEFCDTETERDYTAERPAVWTVSDPSRGLGDTVAKVMHRTGIQKLVYSVSTLTGIDCGCAARQEHLNELFTYKIEA